MNKKKSFFNEECEICKETCNSIRFKQNFQNWTSEFTNETVLNKVCGITQNPETKDYIVVWITWDYKNDNWKRNNQNISVFLKISNNPTKTISELTKETVPNKVCGITQNPETKNYIVVWNEICGKCKHLSKHSNWDVSKVLEWIPYNRFNDIEYIAKGGFGKVYRANWIDGPIKEWNYENDNWKRNQDEIVALKSLNNSENVSLEFMNEIISHHTIQWNLYIIRLYGMTQDPEQKIV
ncbi:kinase-like domain-containing protein [Rhizophagus irregularis DAOM 181602=DAOM 197198]|nr:kinase-like domain-containing protein [Rhizophagus irregularis DAOM 181602=DAOM 197198]